MTNITITINQKRSRKFFKIFSSRPKLPRYFLSCGFIFFISFCLLFCLQVGRLPSSAQIHKGNAVTDSEKLPTSKTLPPGDATRAHLDKTPVTVKDLQALIRRLRGNQREKTAYR